MPATADRRHLRLEALEDRLTPTADMVLQWNEAARAAAVTAGTAPPAAARIMAITHAAIYDSVNTLTRTHEPFLVDTLAHPKASPEAAVAAAAHRALTAFYPAQALALNARLTASLAIVPDGKAEDDGVSLGRSVADQILALRQNDGAGVVLPPYLGGTAPGEWRPTPPANLPGAAPHWGGVTPFTMTSGDQFRPAGPPALTSSEYTAAFHEVRELGAINSPTRTVDETEIAKFWQGASPGHWNQIAATVSESQGLTLAENARMFALLNLAGADSYIASFDIKYTSGFWRPVTAIRAADTDGNPDTAGDPTWTPLLVTPNHPSYSSGHSTFGGAAATVLAGFYGTDAIAFTSTTSALPGVTRSFASFSAAADENARSRLLAGIHWSFDNDDGLSAGRALGDHLMANFLRPEERGPAAGVVNGELIVVGTDGDDFLHVGRVGGSLVVWADGVRLSTFAPTVTGIVVDARGGDDHILLAPQIETAAELYGGAGDDLIRGGGGDDRIYGEDGDDRLFGGLGNDALFGGPGDDCLFGGPGLDFLDGGDGDNHLVP